MLNFSLNMPLRITVDCATLVAAYIFREGLVCPSSTHFLDWLYTAGFYCRGAIGNDFSDQGFARALDEALSKASKIVFSSRPLSTSVYLWQSW